MSTLLVLGTLDADWTRSIEDAALRSSLSLSFLDAWDRAAPEVTSTVVAVVLGRTEVGMLQTAERLRRDERLERVTLLATQQNPKPTDYVDSLTAGIDDLLSNPADVVGVAHRLQAARDAATGPQRTLRRGLALASGPSSVRSSARARALASAGFRATVDSTADAPWLREPRLALVVWEPTDARRALDQVRQAREAGALCRFVLCVPDSQATEVARECELLEGVRVLPESSPPDSVVFVVNEMAESTVRNQRASRRRLASTLVRFEASGRRDLGLSYNVSAGGLYVRTLAPPPSGTVDLSVDVFGAPAELVCEVAWSRALSHDGTATAPPGFGVKIVQASEGARTLLASLGSG